MMLWQRGSGLDPNCTYTTQARHGGSGLVAQLQSRLFSFSQRTLLQLDELHLQHLIPHSSPELNFNENKNSFIMSSDMSGNVVKTPTGLKVNGSEKLDYNFHYVSPVFDISHAKLAETYKPWGRVLIVLDKSESSVRFGRSPTCERACSVEHELTALVVTSRSRRRYLPEAHRGVLCPLQGPRPLQAHQRW
jgi:hypothetical protein